MIMYPIFDDYSHILLTSNTNIRIHILASRNADTCDHVIPLYVPECRECRFCLSSRTNMCEKTSFVFSRGVLFEGTSRFTCRGQTINHYLACSTFSQYTVVAEICVAKIPKNIPLEKACLLGCGISTGYGSAINTAQVEEGSTCAIWGLGGIGLAVAVGCKAQKAARIIGVDTNESKFHMAREFGLTEFINPNKIEKPIAELLKEMTDGGCDYTFECIGNVKAMRAAFESSHPSLGVAVVIGVAPEDHEVSVLPANFLTGRRWTGSFYGGWKPRSSMARLVNDYEENKIPLDKFLTFTKSLDEINEGFDLMRYGKAIRTVIKLF
ncbi:Alcohol dehydrogenase C-terminal [Trinorchestia longiramus]|nr:Alcohol dehydrogenase C-terminal [Trinorchestia longiramus]